MFDVNVLYVVLFYYGVYMEKIYWVYCKEKWKFGYCFVWVW